jgi:alkylation response protein AidB-like acyl-CoA dehydrogenase
LTETQAVEADFRERARTWLANNAPRHLPTGIDQGPRLAAARSWQRRLHDAGWAGLAWPRAYGGQGLSGRIASIFQQEEAKVLDWVTVKGPFNVAFYMAGPAILNFGTDEQRAAHIPTLLRGEEFWCQLFSEPDAGSDLGSLATVAVRDADCYVLNGQKVWSSYAHYAQFGLLLARTDPDAPKHRGISYFLLDMSLPGIEVRPLRQMNGGSDFNEVFFNDVYVPLSSRLGKENDGWAIAHSTLGNERQYLGAGILTQPRFPGLKRLAQDNGRCQEAAVRQRLAVCYTREEILRYMALQVQHAADLDMPIGVTPSLMKLAQTAHVVSTANDALVVSPSAALGALGSDDKAFRTRDTFLMSPAMRVGGGTDDIQKQTIAERALGLPREPDPSRTLPWRQTHRTRSMP